MEELVKGVRLIRPGEYLEQVQSPGLRLELIASWDGTEVIRQHVPAGKRFVLRPEDGWNALECLHVLAGTAVWENGARSVTLGPGDSLTGSPVRELCMVLATTDLTALYICSQPMFHQVSEERKRMMDLAVAVEMKDGYTKDHCFRINLLSTQVGSYMKLDSTTMYQLMIGSFLHDLGKVRVPDEILNKPGRLTPAEWTIMRQHTVHGRDMLMGTSIEPAAYIPMQHHERLDGSGYPMALAGNQITVEAQIVAVVDSYDAMTSQRVYKPAMRQEQALDELTRCSGRLYRPDVVEAFVTVIARVEASGAQTK